jgi:glutathione S-transferase
MANIVKLLRRQEEDMSLTLYAHPFAAYCWKALIALYENDVPFSYRLLDNAGALVELEAIWPIKKFPVLTDGERTVIESTIIVEYLKLHYPRGTNLIPDHADAALNVRFMDRFFDNYIMTPMQTLVSDRMRAEGEHDFKGVADARAILSVAYQWLEKQIGNNEWAAGDDFTLADCAAAPALFYADWVYSIDDKFSGARAYRARLLARPSVARVVDEARPYRSLFPLGAPNRD